MKKKGVIHIDFIVGASIFLVSLVFVFHTAINYFTAKESSYETLETQIAAFSLMRILVLDPGNPPDWVDETTGHFNPMVSSDEFRLGLADYDPEFYSEFNGIGLYVLSWNKVRCLDPANRYYICYIGDVDGDGYPEDPLYQGNASGGAPYHIVNGTLFNAKKSLKLWDYDFLLNITRLDTNWSICYGSIFLQPKDKPVARIRLLVLIRDRSSGVLAPAEVVLFVWKS